MAGEVGHRGCAARVESPSPLAAWGEAAESSIHEGHLENLGVGAMFDKMKDLGTQVANKTNEAVGGIATSLKEGVDSLTNTATNVRDTLNEKAVRASTAQMYRILEIAIDELRDRPLSERPVSLTATVNIGIAALEMQIQMTPSEKNDYGRTTGSSLD